MVIVSWLGVGDGVGVAVSGGTVGAGDGVDVETVVAVGGDGSDGVGVPASATTLDAVASVVLLESGTVPCPAANWLTTKLPPSTLIPSPTPMEALPIVRSADRTSGESPTRRGPLPR